MRFILAVLAMTMGLWGCRPKVQPKTLAPIPFSPYVISDSSEIDTMVSGLRIFLVEEGPGAKPLFGDQMRIHYEGRLTNGKIFDSSYQHGEPFTFVIGGKSVIPGLDEGVQRMRMGSKAILFIPPHLGYGAEAQEGIPSNSTLIFHVESLGTF